jgi:ABC-2 type transport system ATP-binding protein
MKQRIKLASAIIHDPEILFLDEPTNGMDPEGREEMLTLIDDLVKKREKNVFLCSHLLQDVEQTCEDIHLLYEGKLRISGRLELLKQEKGNVYRLKVKGDIPSFIDALRLKRCEVSMERNNLKIWMPENTPLKRIFEIAYQKKIQIRHLSKSERSLEEIFIDAVKNNEEGLDANI